MMKRTVGAIYAENARRFAHVLALNAPHRHPPLLMTYAELGEKINALAGGLLALGVAKGDRVALISDNCPEWIISDVAILTIGAICVPRGSDTTTAELWYIINHSEAKIAIIENRKLFERLGPEIATVPALRSVILLDDSAGDLTHHYRITPFNFSDVCARGREKGEHVAEALQAVEPEDIAALVYTSGTTGIPKGVLLRHSNFVYQCEVIDLGFPIRPGDVLLSILPSWHVYERMAEYLGMYYGATIYYTNKRRLREDMVKANPSFIPCVPRIWESVYDAIMAQVHKQSPSRIRLVTTLIELSGRYIRNRRLVRKAEVAPKPAGRLQRIIAALRMAALSVPHKLADVLLYRKIRTLTSSRLKAAVSGGGSFATYLDDFFEAAGIPILNGYGLTETAPVVAVRSTQENIRGTVGRPLRGTSVEIRDEDGKVLPQGQIGVIWVKGPQVMKGYFRNDDETRRVLTDDGWFNTGDLGWFTWQGQLVVSGRAKDTIVLSSGENVEPERIEAVARKHPLIDQIVVVGQDKKALGALVVPDFANLAARLRLPADSPPEKILSHPDAPRIIRESINAALAQDGSFRPFEFIQHVHLLHEPFTPENGLLTQTLKPKRNMIAARYAAVIDNMLQ
jgi:long-chain acyl-CoA synthetase